MTRQEAASLRHGDTVVWQDPSGPRKGRMITVAEVDLDPRTVGILDPDNNYYITMPGELTLQSKRSEG